MLACKKGGGVIAGFYGIKERERERKRREVS
jgi:hypothetical protein